MKKNTTTLSHVPAKRVSAFSALRVICGVGLCFVGFAQTVLAQSVLLTDASALRETAAVEFLAGYGALSDGYGSAQNYTLRGIAVMPLGTLQAEVARQSRFGFTGNYGSLAWTRDWSADYRSWLSVGVGDSVLFPKSRVDAAAYAKFGNQRQYAVGVGGYDAEGNEAGRSDTGLVLNGIYYGNQLVLEGGLRINRAQPGAATGASQFVAATFGIESRRALILRAERANETWQVLTTGPAQVDFISHTVGAQWRERMTRDGTLILGVGYYQSPNYNRSSLDVGWRWSFR